MYVCVFVWLVYPYLFDSVSVYSCLYFCALYCGLICICVCLLYDIFMCLCICLCALCIMYICLHVCLYKYVYMLMCKSVGMSVWLYGCMCVHVCGWGQQEGKVTTILFCTLCKLGKFALSAGAEQPRRSRVQLAEWGRGFSPHQPPHLVSWRREQPGRGGGIAESLGAHSASSLLCRHLPIGFILKTTQTNVL